ncbi:MAG: DUF2961 domain-containing protein [Planctomycetes bacterium]|nr:DUF2961 domain-containing protein [Planctomycetota bacterium]
MRALTLVLLSGVVVSFAGASVPAAAAEIRYSDLLDEMIDLRALARLPRPAEKCFQSSSYDRRSKSEADKAGWNANADHGHYLRQEGDEYVMADEKGPGMIVRIWSANPQGTLKIYIDGAAEPAVAAPAREIEVYSWQNPERTRTPGGRQPAWVFPEPIGTEGASSAFCGRRAAGWNLYLPIPFQKSLKVTVEKPDRPSSLYYHVNIRSFAEGARVPAWSMDLVRSHEAQLKRIFDRLSQPDRGLEHAAGEQDVIDLYPGAMFSHDLYGPGAITLLKAEVEAEDPRAALREVVVRATFDGAREPQVCCPLGDFFGTMPGKNLYASLPLGAREGFFYSRWYMPFRDSARIELINEGRQDVRIEGLVDAEPITWSDDLGYFHAKWRRTPKNTTFDWPILECEGRGRVVGVALGIFNPVSGWWGEGDEKIWIDGESFPSTFGTGSEDYFGYAWCNTALFQHAYHNQTLCEGPGNGNHTSVNRFHVIDSLPFHRSIRFTIEDWPLGNTIGKDYCATAYWYAAAGQKDFFEPVPRAGRVPRPAWKPFRIDGLLEGESLKVIRAEGGDASPQDVGQFGGGWSGARHLWWRPTANAGVLSLAFDAREAGRYEVIAYLTRSWDYGRFRFSVNGKPAGEAVDLFSGKARLCEPTGPIPLGAFDLEKGANRLEVKLDGRNEKSPGYYFGLDGILLKK